MNEDEEEEEEEEQIFYIRNRVNQTIQMTSSSSHSNTIRNKLFNFFKTLFLVFFRARIGNRPCSHRRCCERR